MGIPTLLSSLALDSWAQELSNLDLPSQICAPESIVPSFLWPSPLHRYRFTLEPDVNAWSKGTGPELRIMKPLSKGGICDLSPNLCEWAWNCNEESCPASCSWSTRGACVVDFPPSGGCVKIARLAKGAWRSTVSWQLSWDLKMVIHIVVGAALFWGRKDLREAKLVHALIGVCFIVVFSMILVFYVTYNYSRKVASSIPLLGMCITLSPLLFFTAPSWYLTIVAPTSWTFIWSLLQPWLYSVAGLCIGAVISVYGAQCGLRWFASDLGAPAGQAEFTIGSDGRRIDNLLADSWQQRVLGFLLGVVGIALVLASTYSKYLSAVIAVVVILQNYISQYSWEISALQEVVKPEYFRSLMSQGDYEDEGYKRTALALESLKDFACKNREMFLCLRDAESELRFRRFVDGGDHIRLPCEEEDEPSGNRWCTIL